MKTTEINTWAERAARAAYDSGNRKIAPKDALHFVTNAARENDEPTPPPMIAREFRQFQHDYERHLRLLIAGRTCSTTGKQGKESPNE